MTAYENRKEFKKKFQKKIEKTPGFRQKTPF